MLSRLCPHGWQTSADSIHECNRNYICVSEIHSTVLQSLYVHIMLIMSHTVAITLFNISSESIMKTVLAFTEIMSAVHAYKILQFNNIYKSRNNNFFQLNHPPPTPFCCKIKAQTAHTKTFRTELKNTIQNGGGGILHLYYFCYHSGCQNLLHIKLRVNENMYNTVVSNGVKFIRQIVRTVMNCAHINTKSQYLSLPMRKLPVVLVWICHVWCLDRTPKHGPASLKLSLAFQ